MSDIAGALPRDFMAVRLSVHQHHLLQEKMVPSQEVLVELIADGTEEDIRGVLRELRGHLKKVRSEGLQIEAERFRDMLLAHPAKLWEVVDGKPMWLHFNLPCELVFVCKEPVQWMVGSTRIGEIKGPGYVKVIISPDEGKYSNGFVMEYGFCSPRDRFESKHPCYKWTDDNINLNKTGGMGMLFLIFHRLQFMDGCPTWFRRYMKWMIASREGITLFDDCTKTYITGRSE